MTNRRVIGALVALSLSLAAASGSATGAGPRFSHHLVSVYFTRDASLAKDCSGTKEFGRLTSGRDHLHDALSWLLKGPRPGEEDSVTSFFSSRTAGMLNKVRVRNGVARVDFDDFRRKIPEASSACGSASLLAELNRTAKQFRRVDRAVYSFEGNVNAFYNWLQREPPRLGPDS